MTRDSDTPAPADPSTPIPLSPSPSPPLPDEPPIPTAQAHSDPSDETHGGTPPPPRHDPWAHRRGEPRLFAFLWTTFLFAATTATFLAALSTGSAGPDVMRPATRMLQLVTALGIVVVWPLVRLSQSPDPHPISGGIQDLIVILVPIQAIIWPQWLDWLGRWPIPVVAAAAALLAAWSLLISGLIAHAQLSHLRAQNAALVSRSPPDWKAWRWMATILALGLGGLVAPLLFPVHETNQIPFRPAWMLTAPTGILELTRDRSWTGTVAAVARQHWWAIAAVASFGLLVWMSAVVRASGGRAGRRLN